MIPLHPRTQLRLLKQRQPQSILAKGFTLVELMVVIVIVGILAGVALPNFLNQTAKAKGTEAKTKLNGLLKEAHAEFLLDGTTETTQDTVDISIEDNNQAGIYDYDITVGNPVTTGTATGNGTDDNVDNTVVYNGCVNMDTGEIEISSVPGQAVTCVEAAG
jgi:type IV pilus assembly protein PilA